MSNDNRRRMVRSAAALIGSRGVNATSFSDVLAASEAPRGSIYHYFPAGKKQLAEDAVRWTSEEITAYLRSFPGGSPADAVAHFVDLWRQTVVSSDGAAGCPLAGVALDTAGDQALLALIRREFTAWVDVLVEQLLDAGLAQDRATSIAWLALASMEGSLILCRATGDSAPLEAAASELQRLASEAS